MSHFGADGLVSRTLAGVTASWHRYAGRVDRATPIHIWLWFDRLGSVQAHTAGDGSLSLTLTEPYAAHDMGEYGEVLVDGGCHCRWRRSSGSAWSVSPAYGTS
jgi:hypothetical protein